MHFSPTPSPWKKTGRDDAEALDELGFVLHLDRARGLRGVALVGTGHIVPLGAGGCVAMMVSDPPKKPLSVYSREIGELYAQSVSRICQWEILSYFCRTKDVEQVPRQSRATWRSVRIYENVDLKLFWDQIKTWVRPARAPTATLGARSITFTWPLIPTIRRAPRALLISSAVIFYFRARSH